MCPVAASLVSWARTTFPSTREKNAGASSGARSTDEAYVSCVSAGFDTLVTSPVAVECRSDIAMRGSSRTSVSSTWTNHLPAPSPQPPPVQAPGPGPASRAAPVSRTTS